MVVQSQVDNTQHGSVLPSLAPRPLPRVYPTANDCRMKSGQRAGNESTYCLHVRMNKVLMNSWGWGKRERRRR